VEVGGDGALFPRGKVERMWLQLQLGARRVEIRKKLLIPMEAWVQKFVECLMIRLVVEEPASAVA
jgi:hypothetical protein